MHFALAGAPGTGHGWISGSRRPRGGASGPPERPRGRGPSGGPDAARARSVRGAGESGASSVAPAPVRGG
jgi:hypothetical protein